MGKPTYGSTVVGKFQSSYQDFLQLVDAYGNYVLWIDSKGNIDGPSGLPSFVSGNATVTGQTSSIVATTMFTPTVSGMFAVYTDILVTQAGSAGTVSAVVAWNNGITDASLTTDDFSLATQAEFSTQLGCFYVAAGKPITYSTTVMNVTGSPIYQLAVRLVSLG